MCEVNLKERSCGAANDKKNVFLFLYRFGMVTEDTDVEELLELVISVGKRVQENSKVLDTMSEIVKKVL